MSEAPKEADPPKKKSKMMLIIIAAVLLLGGGGGAAYFMMKGKPPPDPEKVAEEQRKHEMKSKVYVPLDPFTVNLADEKDARLAQIAVVLEVGNNELAEEIKGVMPTIRNRVLMILSAKLSKDLLTVEGKEQLALQIGDATAVLVGHAPEPVKKAKAKPVKEEAKEEAEEGDEESDEEEKPKKKPAKAAKAPAPLVRVNFSQFIVQ